MQNDQRLPADAQSSGSVDGFDSVEANDIAPKRDYWTLASLGNRALLVFPIAPTGSVFPGDPRVPATSDTPGAR